MLFKFIITNFNRLSNIILRLLSIHHRPPSPSLCPVCIHKKPKKRKTVSSRKRQLYLRPEIIVNHDFKFNVLKQLGFSRVAWLWFRLRFINNFSVFAIIMRRSTSRRGKKPNQNINVDDACAVFVMITLLLP